MKRYRYTVALFMAFAAFASSCKKDLVATNINPTTLYSVDPGYQFLTASNSIENSYEFYADIYRSLNPWMQYTVGISGNNANFNVPSAFNTRYGNFYGGIAPALADIPQLIKVMTPAEQAARVYENNIATIFKAYYAFYVSDINGSIPYSQAFGARYGGTLTPMFDTQESLFDTLDAQIKAAVTSLEATQPVTQVLYGTTYDAFFGSSSTEVLQWIKTGNALRLKIAMRLMKSEPTKLQSIATEVLADPNQMSGVADSWVMYGGPYFLGGGNNNPAGFWAPRSIVNFMSANNDPRLSMFYRKNKNNVYLGSPVSPDSCLTTATQANYADTLYSQIQHKLFQPTFVEPEDNNTATNGTSFIPLLTYAEYCFIRAELGARSITSDVAATWYANGVTASIQFYDQRTTAALVETYTPVTQAQITNYLATPGIVFNPDKAVEQIACQAYLDFYRQPSEAWAWWKRTGYPNTTSVVAWSPLTAYSTPLTLIRRASLSAPVSSAPNYTNITAAYTAMLADPNFGTSLSDVYGRVWWDQP